MSEQSFENAAPGAAERLRAGELRRDLAAALNRNNVDGRLGVPDFVLAEYLVDCLKAHARLVVNKAEWAHGDPPEYIGTFPL